ncbi:Rieske 2Fe-2S domain-containing protein [Sagittula salina]|uniref:Rieske 2Fe-2S domain-containing protein n=1 Tax=Sagittula salina TaxID=2820268 RepID=A0A940MUC1_9RHOB|nr:Rieske 2Fe-2S domain-containing protein [Sagittula salina]MBP0484808.1 Rieske 2Fe-2S domain-containing protein [Sagittula salina]
MADRVDACATDHIDAEDVIRFDHGSRTFVIIRDHADNYSCTDGLCTHEDVHLSDGLVVKATIECPKHSAIFDCSSGEVETPPAGENLCTCPVRVDAGRVFVEV